MIELLILYKLTQKVLTMYGISRDIHSSFSVLTTPSYGTIKPALNRLEKSGFVKTQKAMSAGGRPSTYYSITDNGHDELVKLLLDQPLDNPVQFLTNARLKVACSEILNSSQKKQMFKILKQKSESIYIDTKNLLNTDGIDFYSKIIYDNMLCEYKNFIMLLEELEHACNNK